MIYMIAIIKCSDTEIAVARFYSPKTFMIYNEPK